MYNEAVLDTACVMLLFISSIFNVCLCFSLHYSIFFTLKLLILLQVTHYQDFNILYYFKMYQKLWYETYLKDIFLNYRYFLCKFWSSVIYSPCLFFLYSLIPWLIFNFILCNFLCLYTWVKTPNQEDLVDMKALWQQ